MQTGGVDERHLTHADDAHLGMMAVAGHDVLETGSSTEEVRSVDLVDLDTLGDGEVLQVATLHIGILVEVDLIENGMYLGGLSHTTHEEQTGTDEAKLDGDGEVEDDGEEEGEQQHGDIALGIATCHGQERAPSAHAIADHHQDTCQAGHGDILRQGHKEQEDEQQHQGMDDACHRSATAIVDVGHGAGNGSRGGNTAKQGRCDVGKTLSDELGVRVVMVANDTIGHGGREQRLDGS